MKALSQRDPMSIRVTNKEGLFWLQALLRCMVLCRYFCVTHTWDFLIWQNKIAWSRVSGFNVILGKGKRKGKGNGKSKRKGEEEGEGRKSKKNPETTQNLTKVCCTRSIHEYIKNNKWCKANLWTMQIKLHT